MYDVAPPSASTPPDTVEDRPAPDTALRHRADFATNAAKAALGHAYARPEAASFVDRRPGEISLICAGGWRGAAR